MHDKYLHHQLSHEVFKRLEDLVLRVKCMISTLHIYKCGIDKS